jgi:hypothetical protein
MSPEEFEEMFVVGLGGQARVEIWDRFQTNVISEIRRLDILCEVWLDGSFITQCDEPSDLDGSIMLSSEVVEGLNEDAINYLNLFDDSEAPFHETLDIFLCIVYPKEHEMHSDMDNPEGWAKQWSSEHNSDWLKGFVVIPFR